MCFLAITVQKNLLTASETPLFYRFFFFLTFCFVEIAAIERQRTAAIKIKKEEEGKSLQEPNNKYDAGGDD